MGHMKAVLCNLALSSSSLIVVQLTLVLVKVVALGSVGAASCC